MQYRRFGRTNKALSVITLGGMRYDGGWSKPKHEVHKQMIDECRDTVRTALDLGINVIETAHGYGKSEHCLGIVLNEELRVPRDQYFFMTKGAPKTGDEAKKVIDEQLAATRLDRFDLYAWHGINSPERLELATAKGGPIEVLKRFQEQGVIGNIGFSTHGDYPTILSAIATDLFDFVNLHYYYFFHRNWGAVQLARTMDLGVFIISPNDKGGQLFKPPPLLEKLCHPLTPSQFNARFCLRTPLVQTVCFGVHRPEHFEQLQGVLPVSVPMTKLEQEILARLDARLLVDPLSAYDGDEFLGDPSGINVPEVLRFRRMLKCYDMLDFGRYRYNMFTPGSDWFGGEYATSKNLSKLDLSRAPADIPIKEMLAETHRALYIDKSKV